MSTVLDEPETHVDRDVDVDVVVPPPGTPAPGSTSGFPSLDLRLVQLVVEHAAESASCDHHDSETPERVLVEQIGLLESLQHTLAAAQAALTPYRRASLISPRPARGRPDQCR